MGGAKAKAGKAKAGRAKAGTAKARGAKAGKDGQGADEQGAEASGQRSSLAWLQGLLCGGMVALAPALAVLLGTLAAPSLVALAFDRSPGRPVLRAVALCNLSACVGPVRALWSSDHRLGAGFALIADPRVLGLAWAAGAAGWLLGEIIPLALRVVLEGAAAARAARLRARRVRLGEEWQLPGPE